MCSNYFYYDESKNKYICTEKLECSKPYDKLIHGRKECVKLCSETKENKYEIEFGLIKKCLKRCPEPFYELEDRPNYCSSECPKDNPFLLLDSLECISNCSINQRQNKLCITNYINKKGETINIFDIIINQTRNELMNNFDKSVVDGNKINEKKLNITITRTKKENIKDNDINLGECEDRLIKYYNITPPESLYILRIDMERIGMKVPSLEYELLYPINGNKNLVKLDLSICHDIKINRIININITGNIDKYIKNSPYYNDICYITETDDGIDISLSDRKENYINNNMGICEEGCEFISYNYETKKAICSCGIKTKIPLINDIKIDKNTLLDSFTDINNIANIQMLKCYKVVFHKNNILKNIGFFFMLF